MFYNKKIKKRIDNYIKLTDRLINRVDELERQIDTFYNDTELNRVIARNDDSFLRYVGLSKQETWVSSKSHASIFSKSEAEYIVTKVPNTHIERIDN